LLGIPGAIALAFGWLQKPGEHLLPLILGGIFLFFILMGYFISVAVIAVMTKDFVVPYMVVENVTTMEGWRRFWPALKAEQGGYAGYIGMKIVLAIAAGIIFTIISVLVFLILAVPLVIAGVMVGVVAAAAGLAWNPITITLAAVAFIILLAVIIFVFSLINVPVAVFFPAYSIHFLASRYPGLDALLHPAPPAPPAPAGTEIPPPVPPSWPPEPSPIG
jgi:hypothetical protein